MKANRICIPPSAVSVPRRLLEGSGAARHLAVQPGSALHPSPRTRYHRRDARRRAHTCTPTSCLFSCQLTPCKCCLATGTAEPSPLLPQPLPAATSSPNPPRAAERSGSAGVRLALFLLTWCSLLPLWRRWAARKRMTAAPGRNRRAISERRSFSWRHWDQVHFQKFSW